ncbi:MBL fold metallo-hydrolase [Actinomarinicola tropica]|uniref:MBL fold metallo-hydrolase n=1 Tax=Actinomarinicola tropica TaxID=2789776 RepID=A0A5Q2RHT4_9ACTN|nr:MBL fold metallo-hydrolase [Actinomarinicola tropica]QGG96349.1 MBL fold metallo-hydrolase [Actinomarinicola tropica]
MAVPFDRDFTVEHGHVDQVSPTIRRIVAPNPGRFTFTGTGTYVVGHGTVAVIDPGPNLPEHLTALEAALDGETVSHILITHTHGDHSPAAAPLKARTGALTYGYGPHPATDVRIGDGEDDTPQEERSDRDFVPDVELRDGDVVAGDGWTFDVLHTPGHISNHLCFAYREEKALFTGDHVMGWSTSVIPSPDGDLTAYMANLRRLLDRDDDVYWPTHGKPIHEPRPYVAALIAHREERTRQIVERLSAGDRTIDEVVPALYADVDPALHPAAARSVLAHLVALEREGAVHADGDPLTPSTTWTLRRGRP